MRSKRYMTRAEVMVAMALVALVIGVTALYYRSSVEEERAALTKQMIGKLKNILDIELSKEPKPRNESLSQYGLEEILKRSHLVPKRAADGGVTDEWMRDAWGGEFQVTIVNEKVQVVSPNLEKYESKRKK